MGGGKSYALCAEAIRLSLDYPGNVGIMARKEFRALSKTTMVTFGRLCPQGIIKNFDKTKSIIDFIPTDKNGLCSSRIYFMDCESSDKFKSMEVGWFALDEATEINQEVFDVLTTRLRHRLPNGKCPRYTGFLASNPAPGWVKERFVTQDKANHDFIAALPTDNPYLPQGYVDEIREANEGNEDFIEAYLKGNWNVFAGQVYKQFSFRVHVVKPFDIDKEWSHYVGVDVGGTNPWAVLFIAVSPDDDIVVYDEIYQAEKPTEWYTEQIKNKVGQDSIRGYFIDPAAKQTRLDFQEKYKINVEPASNDVVGGINEVKKYLPVNHFTGKPKIRIFNNCKNLIWEMGQYAWGKNKDGTEKDSPVKVNDHAVDALRYIISSYRNAGKPVSVDSYVDRYGTAYRKY